jgi:hypothetical protein
LPDIPIRSKNSIIIYICSACPQPVRTKYRLQSQIMFGVDILSHVSAPTFFPVKDYEMEFNMNRTQILKS